MAGQEPRSYMTRLTETDRIETAATARAVLGALREWSASDRADTEESLESAIARWHNVPVDRVTVDDEGDVYTRAWLDGDGLVTLVNWLANNGWTWEVETGDKHQ